MKYYYPFLFILFLVSCEKKEPYDPSNYLSAEEQNTMLWKTIRYSTQLAPMATHETKFDTTFDWYYKRAVREYDVRAWYKNETGDQYFLMSRQARSITPMREAIGGKLRMDDQGNLTDYEEIFRTWKMPDEVMSKRIPMLFGKMVAGETLEPYYPKNAGDQYIEFPDGRFYFDKEARRWRDKDLDSLQLNPQ